MGVRGSKKGKEGKEGQKNLSLPLFAFFASSSFHYNSQIIKLSEKAQFMTMRNKERQYR
jgi:hypothetical protein